MSRTDASRVVLVHDWLNQMGGAESVLETLVRLFPGAPVYTSIYAPNRMPASYRSWEIRTSFMQHLPGVASHHQSYLPLYPLAFSHARLTGCDLVLSNKSGFCHGVAAPAGAVHVCYCLAPTRFLWQYDLYSRRERLSRATDLLLRPMLAALRRWDYQAAQRVHHFVAISSDIQQRIKRFYDRQSTIIFPPVDVRSFVPAATPAGDYFVTGGRLIPYKRIDLAVRACTQLGLKLVIYGDGRDRQALEQMAGPSVSFVGRVSHDELLRLLQGASAFLFPGLEDFGIAPVEAQAAGRPVIAFNGGGAIDTVIPGLTGEVFPEQSVQSLADVLAAFDARAYDPAACRSNAERFSTERFEAELCAFVDQAMAGRAAIDHFEADPIESQR